MHVPALCFPGDTLKCVGKEVEAFDQAEKDVEGSKLTPPRKLRQLMNFVRAARFFLGLEVGILQEGKCTLVGQKLL